MTCPEEMGGTNGLQSLHLTGFMVLERELLCLQKQLNILQWDVIKGFSFNFVCWGGVVHHMMLLYHGRILTRG